MKRGSAGSGFEERGNKLWRTNSAGNRVASGVYLYRLETDIFADSRKMVLLK